MVKDLGVLHYMYQHLRVLRYHGMLPPLVMYRQIKEKVLQDMIMIIRLMEANSVVVQLQMQVVQEIYGIVGEVGEQMPDLLIPGQDRETLILPMRGGALPGIWNQQGLPILHLLVEVGEDTAFLVLIKMPRLIHLMILFGEGMHA